MHGGFGLGFLNFLGTILFFVAVFWAVKFFLLGGLRSRRWRGYRGGRRWEGAESEAESEARERLARGEIGEDELNRLKSTFKRGFRGEGWFGGDRALEHARMRLAQGELSVEEFETIRKALGG